MAGDRISLQGRMYTLKEEKECSDRALAAALLEVEMLKRRLYHGRWCPRCKLWLQGLQGPGEKCGTCMGSIEWRPLIELLDELRTAIKALQVYADHPCTPTVDTARTAREALKTLRVRYPV